MNKDLIGGLVLLAVAGIYYWAIGSIAQSSLSDEVGATGLPTILAYALFGIALLLAIRGFLATMRAPETDGDDDDEETASFPRAFGFLLFGAAYVLILPYLGYVVSVALLLVGIALYEGAARDWKVPAVAAGGALFFWAAFVKLLGVHQPVGTLFGGLL
jgi:putative tricarboxylic transport membrane protein